MVARVFQAAYSDDDGSAEEAPYSTKAAGSRQTRLALAEQELGDDDDESEEEEEELDESAQLREPGVASEESEDDEPTTTFAQFVDSDDDDGLGESESESEDNADASSLPLPARTATAKRAGKRKRPNNDGGSDGESSSADDDEEAELKQGLASIPFGELLKAQQSLSSAGVQGGNKGRGNGRGKGGKSQRASLVSASASDSGSGSDQSAHVAGWGRKHEHEHEPEPRKKRSVRDLAARRDKNAPTEESSVRPVSRRRQVVEVRKADRRDPRFSSLSGAANKHEFAAQYGFLKDVYTTELKTLRERFGALVKKERGASGAQANTIAAEREAVGRELDRAQALAAERRRRSEADAIDTQQRRENRQRLAEGKKAFYLKDSDKKRLLLQKRYERLAGAGTGADETGEGEGGSNSKQLRKALERRRKRNAAKERKALPFVADPRRAGQRPKRT